MQQRIADHGDSRRWQLALDELSNLLAEIRQTNASIGNRRPSAADLKLTPYKPPVLPANGNSPASDSLPSGETSGPAQRAPIGVHGNIDADQQAVLEGALMKLHPWRKGPWWLYYLHLDTEWRCDWKWQRLLPHLPNLTGQRILDVGCGNGYYGWEMLNAGASSVVGIDPTVLFAFQHAAINLLLAPLYPTNHEPANAVLPLRLEDLPANQEQSAEARADSRFDSVFSMGVLYHRKDHIAHLSDLRSQLKPGGTLVLETLVCLAEDLVPTGRYARMRNVHLVPRPETVSHWLSELGFENTEARDISPTQTSEQRATKWMRFESLAESLDPSDGTRTAEGHPAPVRASFVANWSP